MARVLMVPSAIDCDPSEVALPWSLLVAAGHEVSFATTTAEPAQADERMLSGQGLSVLAPVLRARGDAVDAWKRLIQSAAYQKPQRVDDVGAEQFDGVIFPGGHAPGMRTYLEHAGVQQLARLAFEQSKVVGAICHGVVVLARAGVLKGRKTTSLTKAQEMLAWNLTRWWLGSYYRTYQTSVQDEVTAALSSPDDYAAGPLAVLRDDPTHLARGFIVEDGNYVSARWPGDAHRFTQALITRLA